MNEKKMSVSFGNAFEISAETENALSKLPAKAQEIAREITRKQTDARNDANEMLAGLQSSADELTKETAKRVLELVQCYNMDKDENAPFKNWGEFAKAAWNKSASWVTQNKRVASEILNSKDKTAEKLSANFNFSQLAELLPLTKDGISPHIADGLKNGTLRPDMKASTDIRDWVKQFLPDSVTKVRLSDIYFVESGRRLDAVNMENYVSEDENTAVASFNPKTIDADTATPWKGKVCVDLQTMKAVVILYHAHKDVSKENSIKHLDATDRIAISIREMPEQFRADIVKSYKDNPAYNYSKLCLLVGVPE